MVYVENIQETQDLYIPRNDGYEPVKSQYERGYEDGYAAGKADAIWTGTQEEYDAIDPKDPDILYIIECNE